MIVSKLNAEIRQVLQSSETRGRLSRLGAEPMQMTPGQFDSYMRDEFTTLGPMLKASGAAAK